MNDFKENNTRLIEDELKWAVVILKKYAKYSILLSQQQAFFLVQ